MATEGLYAEYFGLSERPFTLLPDPDLVFWSPQHRLAMTVLEYGLLSRAPITLVSGEIGAGKTTMLQSILRKIEADMTVGLISNARGGRGELLQWILNAFDVDTKGLQDNYVARFQRFQDFLLAEYAAGRRCVLFVDEAQNLSAEGLEELRMLTNINAGKDELIQLVLVGQPELRDIVRSPQMRQLAQRISASIHLDRLSVDQTRKYVAYRLKAVGGTGKEIDPSAAPLIQERTGGIPRLINQLCDLAMLYAWGAEHPRVTERDFLAVLNDGMFFGDVTAGSAE